MQHLLQQLRQKPKRVKDQIAFAGATAVTGCIALVWVLSLQAEEVAAVPEDSLSSFEESRGAFAQFFGAARNQLASVFAGVEEEAPTTSTPVVAPTSSVVVPQLSPETARRLNPTPIIIGTSSATGTPARQ